MATTRRLLIPLALLGMGFGQYLIRLDPDDNTATFLFLVAAVVAAVLLGREPAAAKAPVTDGQVRSAGKRALGIVGILIGAVLVGTGSVLLFMRWFEWFVPGWISLIVGTAVLSGGLRVFDAPPDTARAWTWGEAAALGGIVVIGAVLRYYRYTDFPDPFGMHAIEEPQVGMRAYQLLHDHYFGWEFLVDNFLGAAGILLVGDRSFTAIRFSFTAASVLTIIPVYGLLRQLVEKPAALGGTFLFAVSSWNIIYARCAHAIFPVYAIVVIILSLLIHFARTNRLCVVPWAAFLCGLTQYSYAAYRVTSVFMLVFLTGLFALDFVRWRRASGTPDGESSDGALVSPTAAGRSSMKRAVWRDFWATVILLTTVVGMLAPILRITMSNSAQPWFYFEAWNRSLQNKAYYTNDPYAFIEQRIVRIRETARIFMHFGDTSITYNLPGEPMLDPLTSVLFVGGFCLAVFFLWQRFHAFLLFIFLGMTFGTLVFVQNLDVHRAQVLTPFVAAFAALFLDRLWREGRRLPPLLLRVVVPPLIGLGAAFAVWWNYDVYFNKMATNLLVRRAFKNEYTVLIHYGRTHPGREMLVVTTVVPPFFQPSDYFWMIDGLMHGRTLRSIDELLPPNVLPRNATIILQPPPARQEDADRLMAAYPGMRCGEFVEPESPALTLITCDVP